MMRTLLNRILEILDGTPSLKRQPERGQSLVEMAFITPLLIILIVGIVEVGWYAHNYLTLLEVTRVGARRGAILAGDNAPMAWDDRASLHFSHNYIDPKFPDSNQGQQFGDSGFWDDYEWFGDGSTWEGIGRRRFDVRQCPPPPNTYIGFYNLVLCQMVASMSPLEINWTDVEEEQTDDIIISVFSVQVINNAPVNDDGDLHLSSDHYRDNIRTIPVDEYEPGYIPVVVGRFPTTANECNVWERIDNGQFFRVDTVERDPFDYYQNESSPDIISVTNPNTGQIAGTYPLEMAYEINNTWVSIGYDDASEMQRGFNYTGYRMTNVVREFAGPGGTTFSARQHCYGSDWTVYDVQELLKGEQFKMSPEEVEAMRLQVGSDFGRDADGNDIDTAQFFANQGLVLVEIFWQHQLLLDLPVFSPVFQAFGSNRTTIYVWSAFPAPAVAPDLKYNLNWQAFER